MFGSTVVAPATNKTLARDNAASTARFSWQRDSDHAPATQSSRVVDDSVDDPFELADAYGSDAAARLAAILHMLATSGFAKARANDYSAFDRILSGVAWALQQLVPRTDSTARRVQWDVLFTSHTRMKPRLGFAEDVVRCIDALPSAWRIGPIQPHQLLLQDFGDIGAVHRLVSTLLEQLGTPGAMPHIDAIRTQRQYLRVEMRSSSAHLTQSLPLKADVAYLKQTFRPQRKWQFTAAPSSDGKEPEDALVQRVLLEYGERVCVAGLDDIGATPRDDVAADTLPPPTAPAPPAASLMAQLASQAAAAATAGASAPLRPFASSSRRSVKRFVDPLAVEFERQYERVRQQAAAEQQLLRRAQHERERLLLQHVVSVPPPTAEHAADTRINRSDTFDTFDTRMSLLHNQLDEQRLALRDSELQLSQLLVTQQQLSTQRTEMTQLALAVDNAIAGLERECQALDTKEAAVQDAAPLLAILQRLVAKNEALKQAHKALRTASRRDLAALTARVTALEQQVTTDTATQDEELLRLIEIEHVHAHMALRHSDLKRALATQTRAVQRAMREIDDVPTRVELLQYERRFLELVDEVALTLDATRKYFATYNTLQTTQEVVEKEIALLDSVSANIDAALATKAAALAFIAQLETIAEGVRSSVDKYSALHATHEARIETLDSTYQLLLEKERAYVDAIRAFQRECERNERLAAKIEAASAVKPATCDGALRD